MVIAFISLLVFVFAVGYLIIYSGDELENLPDDDDDENFYDHM